MSGFVMVKRDQIQRWLDEMGPEKYETAPSLTSRREELRAVLAQEAGHVDEPLGMVEAVAWIDPYSIKQHSDNAKQWVRISASLAENRANGYTQPLYTSPPAPVSVVLPEQKPRITGYWFDLDLNDKIDDTFAKGWNACLDKVKELNQ